MDAKKSYPLFPAAVLLCLAANGAPLCYKHGILWLAVVLFALLANILPLLTLSGFGARLRLLSHGNSCLKLFLICTLISIPVQIVLAWMYLFSQPLLWFLNLAVCFCVLAITFWNGIISVYCTSVQLGIKLRVVGALCGMIPVINLIILGEILKATSEEVRFETTKLNLDRSRQDQQICKTKYPIVLIHGVFFRDSRFFNYWGRIPEALTRNGARIYYGNQPSAASVADCASFLSERIRQICEESGSEKVNIIAHSKGGLDCRYAMEFCGAAPYIASVTTVNTPHRGCKFADHLLSKIPSTAQRKVADTYNYTLQKFGEADADFMAAVTDLTSERCVAADAKMPPPNGIFCQSVGSTLRRARGGKFPLNFSYHLVRYFDGPNDGLVGEDSFRWGSQYTLLEASGPEGISHGDMIDLNRYNLPGFDVREFYVQLVADLRQRGL